MVRFFSFISMPISASVPQHLEWPLSVNLKWTPGWWAVTSRVGWSYFGFLKGHPGSRMLVWGRKIPAKWMVTVKSKSQIQDIFGNSETGSDRIFRSYCMCLGKIWHMLVPSPVYLFSYCQSQSQIDGLSDDKISLCWLLNLTITGLIPIGVNLLLVYVFSLTNDSFNVVHLDR